LFCWPLVGFLSFARFKSGFLNPLFAVVGKSKCPFPF
jgi:hypothetical protein